MSEQHKNTFPRGKGTADRPLTCELWQRDAMPDSPIITLPAGYDPDNRRIDYTRYYDPAYAAAELEQVWKKQWLYAAREEDLPNVGDRLPFTLASLSFIIVRSGADEFKAFYNSCLHRGAMLCHKPESKTEITCPYHGWQWNNDGSLRRIPGHWDFEGVNRLNTGLREVKLERWGGCIFINCDADSPPLAQSLGMMPEHFASYAPEQRYTAVHFRKKIRANWKAVQEAFQESYHLTTTHPEAVPFNADSQVQYDLWPTPNGGIGRTVTPGCTPSLAAGPEATCASATEVFLYVMQSWHYPTISLPAIDPAQDVRAQAAAWHRMAYRETYGRDTSAPDTVLLDSLLYFVFPNFCMWLSEAVPLLYRFLPHETDPAQSYFEVRLLKPVPEGQPAPAPSPCVYLEPEQSIAEHTEGLNFLGLVFDQDCSNLPLVQLGLHAADPTRAHTTLGRYQESIIQFWHELLDRAIPG